jgi:hypothetical protein
VVAGNFDGGLHRNPGARVAAGGGVVSGE